MHESTHGLDTHKGSGRLLQPWALKGTRLRRAEPAAGLASEGHSSLPLPPPPPPGVHAPNRRGPRARPGPPLPGAPTPRSRGRRSLGVQARGRWKAGARPMPAPSYLPRSRQTRRACGSGSRPYSAAAAAAAATCPAAGMRRSVQGAL